LLRQHETHNLAQFDVVDEERNVDWIGSIVRGLVGFVFYEIVLGDHFNVGVFGVDSDWSAQRYCNRSVS